VKVLCAELVPSEFEERFHERPVVYLPLGTLEWHGSHNPLGADFIQAKAILSRAAARFGGMVLPPIWLGPDEMAVDADGRPLVGMDNYISLPRQLPGSLYWVSKGCSRSGSRRSSLRPSEPGLVASWWKARPVPWQVELRRSGGGSSTYCSSYRRVAPPASGHAERPFGAKRDADSDGDCADRHEARRPG